MELHALEDQRPLGAGSRDHRQFQLFDKDAAAADLSVTAFDLEQGVREAELRPQVGQRHKRLNLVDLQRLARRGGQRRQAGEGDLTLQAPHRASGAGEVEARDGERSTAGRARRAPVETPGKLGLADDRRAHRAGQR